MDCARRGIGLVALTGLLAGCGGGEVTPANLPAEQKAPDYGQKSGEKMKEMFGVPGGGGKMTKPDAK